LRPDEPVRPGPADPAVPSGPGAGSGLGLHMVSALARSWGVIEQPDAKIVWARLPLPGAAPAG